MARAMIFAKSLLLTAFLQVRNGTLVWNSDGHTRFPVPS
jgi:hypothetical protein